MRRFNSYEMWVFDTSSTIDLIRNTYGFDGFKYYLCDFNFL